VFRDWQLPQGICHAVYPSRRGVLPAVRAWIDFLSLRIPPLIESNRLHCTGAGEDC